MTNRNVKLRRAMAFACEILFAAGGFAQSQKPDLRQMDLEDLVKVRVDTVSGASKFLENSADVPASVTIVTSEQIRQFGYRTLAEVLQNVRGFNVIYDRNYSYVGIRGFLEPGDYNARILFLLDGHRLNDNIYDGAYVGTSFPVDVSLIDRIEIIRGAGSSVYGTGAFLAVINVITKRGRDLDAAEISGTAGSLRTYKGTGTYGTRLDNGLEMLLSGTEYRSHGNGSLFFPAFDSPDTNNGFAENADRDRAASLFADVIYRDFNIHVVENSRTKQIPTASFETVFNDPRTQTTDTRGYVDIQYSHRLGAWDLLGRASYDWYNYHGTYIYDYAGAGVPPYTQNEDLANGTWADFEFDASRRLPRNHRITFGAEYRPDFRQRQVNYDLSPYVPYLNEQHPTEGVGVYAQDEFRIRSNLALDAGMRVDWQNFFGTSVSPRLGLLYSPAESTRLKLMYAEAFRVPNAYESYYASSISNTVNPNLRPEQVRTLEFEAQQDLGKTYTLTGSLFANRFHHLIDEQSNPAIGQTAGTNSTSILRGNGVEFEASANWRGGIKGQISYSLQSSRDFPGDQRLANSPARLAKARLLVPILQGKLSAGLDGWYTGRLLTISGAELGSYFVANATVLATNLHRKLDVFVSVYNLFNKKYADPAGFELRQASIPQDARTAAISLTYRFAAKTN